MPCIVYLLRGSFQCWIRLQDSIFDAWKRAPFLWGQESETCKVLDCLGKCEIHDCAGGIEEEFHDTWRIDCLWFGQRRRSITIIDAKSSSTDVQKSVWINATHSDPQR